jgi:membrane fusion protein (multidrug efflux system)
MVLADLGSADVTANYKETQLEGMRVGSPAEVAVDAYPDHPFRGHVVSLSAGTGAVFALLPPENATGNFTKVVQRVPIKIAIDEGLDAAHPLRLGMSVEATVDIGGKQARTAKRVHHDN